MATCATLPATRAFRANLERQKVNDSPDGQDKRFFAAFSLLRRHRSAYRLFALPKKFPLNSDFGRFWTILTLFSSAFFHPQNKITARSESRSPLLLPRELALVRTLFGSKKDYTLCFLKNPLMQKQQKESPWSDEGLDGAWNHHHKVLCFALDAAHSLSRSFSLQTPVFSVFVLFFRESSFPHLFAKKTQTLLPKLNGFGVVLCGLSVEVLCCEEGEGTNETV